MKACHLSFAFNEIVHDYAKTVNGELPFTVVHIAVAAWYYEPCLAPGLIAHSLRTKSKRWDDCMPNIKTAVKDERVHNRGSDIPSAVTHYLIVEGVTNGKQERAPYEAFKAAFVQQLQTKIPRCADHVKL